jgi:hypothetical protein
VEVLGEDGEPWARPGPHVRVRGGPRTNPVGSELA